MKFTIIYAIYKHYKRSGIAKVFTDASKIIYQTLIAMKHFN